MARPRLRLPEHDIVRTYRNGGTSISALALTFDVDRTVIRRILREHGALHGGTVIDLTPAEQVCPPGHVSSVQLIESAGITYRQLDYWTRTGRLHPAPRSECSGHPRYYPKHEAAVAHLMGRLTYAGLAIGPAHDIARALLAHGHTTLAGIRLELPQDL